MTTAHATASLDRDPQISELCPPRRQADDQLYAEWVLNVISTMPTSRDAYVTVADRNMWDAWQAEGRKVTAWQAEQAAPAKIPARELRKGDVISSGTIAKADPRDTYMWIEFEAIHGEHTAAIPLDMMITVLSRGPVEADIADPAQDITKPLLGLARGLKPGMALIDEEANVARVVYQVTPVNGGRVKVEFVGHPTVELFETDGVSTTRLSAMAVYHARQSERAVVAELTALAETWEHRATLLRQEVAECDAWVKLERMPHALEAETCAHQLRALLARLV